MAEKNYILMPEQISALLDGELSEAEASSVFHALAANSELQSEFHEQLNVKNFINRVHTEPPASLKNSILASAGMATAAAIAPKSWPKSGLWNNRVISSVAIALVSSVITMLLMLNFLSDTSKQTANQASQIAETPIDNSMKRYTLSDIDQAAGYSFMKQSNAPTVVYKYINAEPTDLPKATPPEELQSAANIAKSPRTDYVREAAIVPVQFIQPAIMPNMGETQRIIFADKNRQDRRFFMNFRKMQSRSYPSPNIEPLYTPNLNDVSAGIYYMVTDNFGVGLEFGQEEFLQTYGQTYPDMKITYEQNYLALWGAAALIYEADEKSWLLGSRPFANLLIGGTEMGPLAKASAGLKYYVLPNVGLFAAFETSTLMYMYSEKILRTDKLGFNYGFSIRF